MDEFNENLPSLIKRWATVEQKIAALLSAERSTN